MEPQTKKSGAANFFMNLGAIVALYVLVFELIDLLFIVINKAYPQINNGYSYFGSSNISWPVASLVILFPIFLLLMWLLGKSYQLDPEKQNSGVRRWLGYITLFLSGLTIAIDLITTLYYFIDGRELTTAFLLKVLVLLVVVGSVFIYYLSDIRNKLTPQYRMFWRIYGAVIVIGAIVWGFSVLGSPRTQQLYKYDEQKVSDLENMNSQIMSYYYNKGSLPKSLEDMNSNYYIVKIDSQTNKPYEYQKTGTTTYNLCAEFNKTSIDNGYPNGVSFWKHPAGQHCFSQTVNPDNIYPKIPVRY